MIYRLTYIKYEDTGCYANNGYCTYEVGLFSSIEKIKEYVYEKIKETEQKNNLKVHIKEDNDNFIRYCYHWTDVTYRIDKVKIIS